MTDARLSDGQVSGSAADVYDAFFVPALFGEWAPRVADAVRPEPGERALDVACGTGVLTRELEARTGAGRVAGLDRNPGMLAVARTRSPEVEWREGRAESLPFPDASFEVVTCQFGLMFFEDRIRSLEEMARVLRPGGRLGIAVWGALSETPGYASMAALLEQLFGTATADELRAPFALGAPTTLKALFARANLPEVEIQTIVGRARFPSLDAWLTTDIRGWTLADQIDEVGLERLRAEAPGALAEYVGSDGRVEFASPAHIVTCTR